MDNSLRLDKYISNATDLSRTDVKKLIKAGQVSVDDDIATNSAQKISSTQTISIDGSTIQLLKNRYFMMNKPLGVVSATKDHSNPTAIDLIYEHRNDQLQIAGNLQLVIAMLINKVNSSGIAVVFGGRYYAKRLVHHKIAIF